MVLSIIALSLVLVYGTVMFSLHNKLRFMSYFTYQFLMSFNEEVLSNKKYKHLKFIIKHYFWMRQKFLGE